MKVLESQMQIDALKKVIKNHSDEEDRIHKMEKLLDRQLKGIEAKE